MRLTTLFVLSAALGGCASNLQVYDDEEKELKGIPVRAPELFVRTGEYTTLADGSTECRRTAFHEFVPLPVGRMFYVNVKTAEFAKTDFTVKFEPNGNLSEITMNTEPSAEALEGAAALITALAPLVGPVSGANVAVSTGGKLCTAGPDMASIEYVPFADWKDRPRQRQH